jgi:hypothetical protein
MVYGLWFMGFERLGFSFGVLIVQSMGYKFYNLTNIVKTKDHLFKIARCSNSP